MWTTPFHFPMILTFCPIPDPTRYWKTLPAGHWSHLAVKMHCPNSWWWWWLLITDSAQAENCPTFHFPCVHPWTGLTSHISPIYEGIISKWILTEPIKPWPPWSLWPFWLIKCIFKKIIVECALITLYCLNARICDMEEDESWFSCKLYHTDKDESS